jgi:hypothetical protein
VTYSQEMHWRMAAKWNQISFAEFIELDGLDQSRLVATYETAMKVEAVLATDAERTANRKSAPKKR